MTDWIANSLDEYVHLAVRAAGDLPHLADFRRPAPWFTEYRQRAAPGSGRRMYEKSPIDPGMITGCPVAAQRVPASMGWPAGSARVAPLRWIHTGRRKRSGWLSSCTRLWLIS